MLLQTSRTVSAALLVLLYLPVAQAGDDATERTRALTHQYFHDLSAADPAISRFWADDVVLFVNNHGPWGGHYRGRDSVAQYYREMAAMFDLDQGIEFELLQFVVDGMHASYRFRVAGHHIRGAYENHYMQVLTWNDGGQVTRIENFYGWAPFLELQKKAAHAER